MGWLEACFILTVVVWLLSTRYCGSCVCLALLVWDFPLFSVLLWMFGVDKGVI